MQTHTTKDQKQRTGKKGKGLPTYPKLEKEKQETVNDDANISGKTERGKC